MHLEVLQALYDDAHAAVPNSLVIDKHTYTAKRLAQQYDERERFRWNNINPIDFPAI